MSGLNFESARFDPPMLQVWNAIHNHLQTAQQRNVLVEDWKEQ